jgi:hypothetical protein
VKTFVTPLLAAALALFVFQVPAQAQFLEQQASGDIMAVMAPMVGMLEGSNRSRVTDIAKSSARDLFEAGLNEAA